LASQTIFQKKINCFVTKPPPAQTKGYKRNSQLKTFEEIYSENYTRLFRVAIKMVGDNENASDIVQDVFIGLYERLSGGSAVLYLNTWLYRATLNKCFDCVNRQKKFSKLDSLQEGSAENYSIENSEKIAIIRCALSKLKPRERAILILYSEGFSYKEISDSTGTRFSSVGKTLERTLEKMEIKLKAQRNELY